MITQKSKASIRLFSFFLTVLLLVSGFLPYAPVKQAHAYSGVGTGNSGTLTANGSLVGVGGGIDYVGDVTFRVGISTDDALKNEGGGAKAKGEMFDVAKNYMPTNYLGIYFVPNDKWRPDFTVGEYDSSVRKLIKMDKPTAAKIVRQLPAPIQSNPGNPGKKALNKAFPTGPYTALQGRGWRTYLADITVADALDMWTYILSPPQFVNDGTLGSSSYDIMNRINNVISPYAKDWGVKELTEAQERDVYAGYLGFLLSTYRLLPLDKSVGLDYMRDAWQKSISDFLVHSESSESVKPTTLVIDPVMTIKWTGKSERLYLSASDYQYFHHASHINYTLNGKINLGASAGNYYDMIQKAVTMDVAANPSVYRTSANYDAANAFSWGASAIDYPKKVLHTSRGNVRWVTTSSETAFIDSLTYLQKDSSHILRGFTTVGFHGLQDKMVVDPTETEMKIKLLATAKNHLIKAGAETIGRRNALSIKSSGLDNDQMGQWKNLLITKAKEVNNDNITLKVNFKRTVTPSQTNSARYSSELGTISNLKMSKSQFLEFLSGNSEIFMFDENIPTEVIGEAMTKKFEYTASLEVMYNNEDGPQVAKSNEVKDYASYIRPKNPPNYMGYSSNHVEYSEIKNDSPHNEEYNAMSGVPSNKRLFYAVGGSEYIIDTELEYVENENSVWRKYQSKFAGTPSEHKAGDNAGTGSIGGQSVDLHNGGTYTKSWSGSIGNKGVAVTTNGSGDVSATSTAVPDRAAYDAAKAEAQAYVTAVNATVISHTASSDKIRRAHKGWGASITTDSSPNPQNVTEKNSCWHDVTSPPDKDGKTTTTKVADPCSVTASPSGATSYSITVTFTVPAHIVDGPECTYDLPAVVDSWQQRINYDYIKIIRAEVYKLEEGKLKETGVVLGGANNEMKASVTQGGQTVWFNIAQKNANGNDVEAQSSKHGRLRYSLEEDKHDVVVWDEGTRTNKSAGMGANGVSVSPDSGGTKAVQGGGHNNTWAKGILYNRPTHTDLLDAHKQIVGTKTGISTSVDAIDMATPEWKKFDERRKLPVKATVISDFIILQTSSGDQSVMYFEKDSKEVKSQEQFPDVNATREEMWEDNPLSSAKWVEEQIYVGSYNGQYQNVGTGCDADKKYQGYDRTTLSFKNNCAGGTAKVPTRLDTTGAGVNGATKRPARPTTQLLMYQSKDIVPTTPNKDYQFGDSTVFYERILTYKSGNPYKDYGGLELRADIYTPSAQTEFNNRMGLIYNAPYSANHDKINDIVIHTPTSSQDAMIIANPTWLDQRTSYPDGGAASMIDKENADRVNYENSLATPNIFDDAIKTWTTTKSTLTPSKTTTIKTTVKGSNGNKGSTGTKDFAYNGTVQTFTAPETGTYTLEVWGAQGGNGEFTGGKGGYSKGNVTLTKGDTINIYVGGAGNSASGMYDIPGGYNGGGNAINNASNTSSNNATHGSGGGATDIRKGGTALSNRIIVAGGGGGAGGTGGADVAYSGSGGDGGGLSGVAGKDSSDGKRLGGKGGTQTSGGAAGTYNGIYDTATAGKLGVGGDSGSTSGNYYIGGAGGGGYYGGGGGGPGGPPGGGGSGYIGGVTGGAMSTGVQSGSGKAKITWNIAPEITDDSETSEQITETGISQTTVTQDYYEYGDANSYKGYTWQDLFGTNWRNYVTTTTSTENTTQTDATSTTTDKGIRYLSRKWTFDSSEEGFTSGTATVKQQNGELKVTHEDPEGTTIPTVNYFVSPDNLGIKNVSAKDIIEFKMRTVSGGKAVKIAFTTTTSTTFNELQTITGNLEPLKTDASGYTTYRVELKSKAWMGTIKQLRIYLATGRPSTEVYLDHIKIYTGSEDTGQATGGTSLQPGLSKTFNNTSTGQSGANANNSTGNLPGNITMSGGIYHWTVPATGTYSLDVYGAQGGNGLNGSTTTYGGSGARMKGDFQLTEGQVLKILVGQQGGSTSSADTGGGGGGGSFVTTNTNSPLIIAGGGGGGGDSTAYDATGGTTSTSGIAGTGSGGSGGSNGSGGNGNGTSGGGGGLTGNGFTSPQGGTSFTNGGSGGSGTYGYGGFGGGGGASDSSIDNGAGGGGYSGGGGGGSNNAGGGGGSYNSGTNQANTSSVKNGHGQVTITVVNASTSGGTYTNSPFSASIWNGLSYSGYGNATLSIGTLQASHIGKTLVVTTANGNSENNTTYKPIVSSPLVQVGIATQGRAWYSHKVTQADVGRSIQISGDMSSWGYVAYFVPDGWDLTKVVSSTTTSVSANTTTDTAIMSNLAGESNQNGYPVWNNSYSSLMMYMKEFPGGGSVLPVPTTTSWHNTNSPHAIFTRTSSSGGGGSTQAGVPVNFPYNGNIQTFTVPQTGTYNLEVWGAEGGVATSTSSGARAGQGGYSTGTVTLTKGELIYVVPGGAGEAGSSGGFNGGGKGSSSNPASTSTGGGATHIAKANGELRSLSTNKTSILIVAGGGGGLEHASATQQGGHGGGLAGGTGTDGNFGAEVGGSGGTQSSAGYNGGFGYGGATGISSHVGGGGGGYYGGGGGYDTNSDGGGGSGYIGGVTGGQTIAGNQSMPKPTGGTQIGQTGNGYARITPLTVQQDSGETTQEIIVVTNTIKNEITKVTERTTVAVDLVKRDLDLFPDYMPDGSYNPVKLGYGVGETPQSPIGKPVQTSGGGLLDLATFITLDREFKIYYPNRGDFAQQPDLRATAYTTSTRGSGYLNAMDTTQWTDSKYVKFAFAVIFNGVLYPSNTWINLPLSQEYFDFYNVLANDEASAAMVEFHSVAINAPDLANDNWDMDTNKTRFSDLTAKHGSYKRAYIDIIGRIGNLAVVDTDDFRFSNLFKQPVEEDEWIVEGVLKKVDPNKQNKYYGDAIDIRGEDGKTSLGLNTYGIQKWLEKPRLSLPINPMHNVSDALHNEYLKVGYDIYGNLQTIGNYADGAVRILPYYYKIEFNNGGDDVELVPLDVYQLVENQYKPVNRYGAADNGYVPSDIYDYPMVVDWENEAGRFNYSVDEATVTSLASEAYGEPVHGLTPNEDGVLIEGVTETNPLMTPKGNYINLGNAQRLVLDSTLRTFIGNTETYGVDKNPGGVLPDSEYYYKGQKWYYKVGLPANSVFVKAGADMSEGNADKAIEEVKQGKGVVLMTADIVAVGNVFSLRYNQYGNPQFTVEKDEETVPIDLTKAIQDGLQPYIALYDLETTAVIDVETQGSH